LHKLQFITAQKTAMKAFTEASKSAVHSSHVVSYQRARQAKADTIG